MSKAFLGMGLLGSNFVKAMQKKGDKVQVWNRTASKAQELEKFGAKAYLNVEDAVKGADRIHVTLKDDASVDEVLEKASSGFSPGAIIIDHTTTSKDGAIKRTAEWKKKGFNYQHAPVFMGPANALESTGYMLVSGDPALIEKLTPELEKMTGKLLQLGNEPGKAASMKLIGNSFLICFTSSIRESLSLAKALEVPAEDVTALFTAWNPGMQLASRLQKITGKDFDNPSWELNMARKDTRLFLEAAEKSGVSLTLLPDIAEVMDKWIQKGFGNSDWTVIAKDAVEA